MSNMTDVEKFISQVGYSLSDIGINGFGLKSQDALQLIDILSAKSIPILGGDVCIMKEGEANLTYDNWFCQKTSSENFSEYCERTYHVAKTYIRGYAPPSQGVALFNLVFPEIQQH